MQEGLAYKGGVRAARTLKGQGRGNGLLESPREEAGLEPRSALYVESVKTYPVGLLYTKIFTDFNEAKDTSRFFLCSFVHVIQEKHLYLPCVRRRLLWAAGVPQ